MAETRTSIQIHPGRSLGWITLGASLHGVLTRLKTQPQDYPTIDLSYSSFEPILKPMVLSLPINGIRLRFDGADQRLRLIEVLDFGKCSLLYKNVELVRRGKISSEEDTDNNGQAVGPSFRHVYNRLFGPSYAGEYIPPSGTGSTGTYILSYPGVAFSFPVKHKAWSEKADFVSFLASSGAAPATSMSVFEGNSWPDARISLFEKTPKLPRSLTLSSRNKELVPDEIDEVIVLGGGKLEMRRRTLPPISVILSQTTPQDLVADFGPPDAIYRKSDSRISIHGSGTAGQHDRGFAPAVRPEAADTELSSIHSHTEESDADVQDKSVGDGVIVNAECFYNYFHHGFDALISFPNLQSPSYPQIQDQEQPSFDTKSVHLVVTKIILHANVPGSYPFNRHRRSRWKIRTEVGEKEESMLNSEMPFAQISAGLRRIWHGLYVDNEQEKAMQRGMVLNRGWAESPESSIELLGGFEDRGSLRATMNNTPSQSVPSLSNTELFGFPGLLFEVLKNDAISCLTIY